ncbi:pyrroline-5-carboxylate reductase [Photobacterium makurazakiensis]|uniref:pyrroline-5-carboxylate reductase n=1 Tax=Photobacterium makurazakiensis TaxID=2910234 RepID=UPI003D138976
MNSTPPVFEQLQNGQASILVIGCGKMGGAIINGWLQSGIASDAIHIVDPNMDSLSSLVNNDGVFAYSSPTELPAKKFDFVLLALKPQMVEKILPLYRDFIASDATLISVAAGITNESLGKLLPDVNAIIRVMPNTPALVQRGVMVACANNKVQPEQQQVCESLFAVLGHFYWVEKESLMDAVTAVSGSGPAYLFLFTECLIEAGNKAGLPQELAQQLAINTVAGAAHLVTVNEKDVAGLRRDVTSPNGTTEAALNVFMEQHGLNKLVGNAVQAASKRSKELAELF